VDISKFLDKVKERELKNIDYALANSKSDIEFHSKKIIEYEERKKELVSKSYAGMESKIKVLSERVKGLGFSFEEAQGVIYRMNGGYFKEIKGLYKTTQHEIPVEGRLCFYPEDDSIMIELFRTVKNSWGTYTHAGPRMVRISNGKIMRVTNNILVALMHRES